MHDYYQREREYKPKAADIVGKAQQRYAVLCWPDVHSFSHCRPPEAVVLVLAPSPEAAQDAVRDRNGPFDCFETRLATKQDEEDGMTWHEYRDRYNTR